MLVAIISVTVVGATSGIVWLAARNSGIRWSPAVLAVGLGVVAGAYLLRRPRVPKGSNASRSLTASQRLVIVAAAGLASLAPTLPPEWQIAVLAFGDTYLVLFLVVLLRRLNDQTPRPLHRGL